MALLGFAVATVSAQGTVSTSPSGKISISSRGKDVREVLYDLFAQVKRNFVLEPMPKTELFLNLADVEFDDALDIVMKQSSFRFDVRNSIYYVSRRASIGADHSPGVGSPSTPTGLPETSGIDTGRIDTSQKNTNPGDPPAPTTGKLADADLRRRLTTRLNLVDIRNLFAEFSRQTGIPIEVDDNVPNYQVKAFLIDTSLKFALDTVTKKAKLRYIRTENRSIRVGR